MAGLDTFVSETLLHWSIRHQQRTDWWHHWHRDVAFTLCNHWLNDPLMSLSSTQIKHPSVHDQKVNAGVVNKCSWWILQRNFHVCYSANELLPSVSSGGPSAVSDNFYQSWECRPCLSSKCWKVSEEHTTPCSETAKWTDSTETKRLIELAYMKARQRQGKFIYTAPLSDKAIQSALQRQRRHIKNQILRKY